MSKSPGEHFEEQQRLKHKILSGMKQFKPKALTPGEQLMFKAENITNEIREIIRPVLKAGAWTDPDALRSMVCKLYIERFSKLDKEELENLCTILHMELMMENIKAAPYGDDTPDLLSGK